MRIPISLHPHQHVLLYVFFDYSHFSGREVVLICIFLMINNVEHLFMCLLATVYLLCWNGYSNSLSVFIYLFVSFTDSSERGREGERDGEKYRCDRETLISCLLQVPNRDGTPNLGMWPDQDPTGDLSVCWTRPTHRSAPANALSFFKLGCLFCCWFVKVIYRFWIKVP